MEDEESGLELSLGLGLGDSSTKSKNRNESFSDLRTEDGDKGIRVEDDLKFFFHPNALRQDPNLASHRMEGMKPQQNLFTDLSKSDIDVDTNERKVVGTVGLWDLCSNKVSDQLEIRVPETGNRHTKYFEDVSHLRKRTRDDTSEEFSAKKSSYVSLNTEEGPVGDNEDVAESEVEVSTAATHQIQGSKSTYGYGGLDLKKEIHLYPNSAFKDCPNQRIINALEGPELKHLNPNSGVLYPVQPKSILNAPFSLKEPNPAGASGSSNLNLFNMLQLMPKSNGDQKSGNSGNNPVTFGYQNVQIPTLDKNVSWFMSSHSQQMRQLPGGTTLSGLDKQKDGVNVSQGMQTLTQNGVDNSLYDLRTLEHSKRQDKQYSNKEEGPSSHPDEDDSKRCVMNIKPKDTREQPITEGASIDISAIKPGILADVKFGGSGSCPSLPWVSATGSGPNGRTISGVTYRFNANQIKIVCACHGFHMSPEEFVHHANDENANPSSSGAAPLTSSSPAASAQS